MPRLVECGALIMAGGRSERMRATAGPLHKALVPVLGIPLIERNLRRLLQQRFQNIVVAVSRKEPEIGAFLETHCRPMVRSSGARMHILWEETPKGTIGAAREAMGAQESLLVINVDNLTSLPLRALVDFHHEKRAALTIASHEEPFRIPFGELALRGENVEQYLEKPVKAVWVSSGTYVLDREACLFIQTNRRTDVPELVSLLLAAGKCVAAFRHDTTWIDVNDAQAVQEAEQRFREISASDGRCYG